MEKEQIITIYKEKVRKANLKINFIYYHDSMEINNHIIYYDENKAINRVLKYIKEHQIEAYEEETRNYKEWLRFLNIYLNI